jgi:hypothetical protein
MRTLLLAAAAAMAFASAASALPPPGSKGPVRAAPQCLTVMCAGRCLPRGVTCHKAPPNCPPGQWACNQTCIPNGQACRR